MGVPAFELIHHGGPVRTKMTHPYSYDPIRHYRNWVGGTRDGAYDDRMYGWDYKKFNDCIERMQQQNPNYGNLRGYSNPTWTRDFLRMYWDAPLLEVVDIVESCNQATGYPCWYFEWVKEPDLNAQPPESVTRNTGWDDYTTGVYTTITGEIVTARTGKR